MCVCVCVCVCAWEVPDEAIAVVWMAGVTPTEAWESLFKVAALCGYFNTNEPLPVSHSTILDNALAGGASLQVHRCCVRLCVCVCVCLAVLELVRSCWSPVRWGCFAVCLSKHFIFLYFKGNRRMHYLLRTHIRSHRLSVRSCSHPAKPWLRCPLTSFSHKTWLRCHGSVHTLHVCTWWLQDQLWREISDVSLASAATWNDITPAFN